MFATANKRVVADRAAHSDVDSSEPGRLEGTWTLPPLLLGVIEIDHLFLQSIFYSSVKLD